MTDFNNYNLIDSSYVVILDDDGIILDANKRFQMYISNDVELVGKRISSLTKADCEEDVSSWLKLIKMGSINVIILEFATPYQGNISMSIEGTYSSHTNSYICTLKPVTNTSNKVNKEIENYTENMQLSEVVNKEMFQSLMDDFYNLTGVPVGIIDITGKIIVAEGWQDACTQFHRINKDTNNNCITSDIQLTEGIKRGEYREYKCMNNLWDVATPIYIGNKLKGHIFIGQFFYDDEEIDMDFFEKQASKYNFDRDRYIKSIESVPRFSRETIKKAMSFYSKLADIIAEMSYSITKLNKTNEVLEDNNAFMNTLMDAIPNPVFYKDVNGRYLGFNDAFNDVVEGADEIAIGKTTYEVHPHDRAKFYDDLDKKLIEGKGEQIYETTVTYSNGSIHEIQFHKAVFFDSLGRVAGIIGVMIDISNQKHIEEELIASKENLEHTVDERTSELLAKNQELRALNEELTSTLENLQITQQQLILSEKMASLGSLVAGMSHEISTPLGISYTSVSYVDHELKALEQKYLNDSMRIQDFEGFIKDMGETITIAETNLERAHHLLNSFKTVAIDQTNNEWRTFKIYNYINEVIFSLDPILKPTNCQVDILCDEDISISGYPGIIAQIITNLVTNTVNHAFKSNDGNKVIIDFSKKDNNFILKYSDNGIGMSENIQSRVFEPFYTTKRGKAGGTGLGLHLVYNLVTQRLGGSIELVSEHEKGTQFIIEFPEYIPKM